MIVIADNEGNQIYIHWNPKDELVAVIACAGDLYGGVVKLDYEDVKYLIKRLQTVLKEFPNE